MLIIGNNPLFLLIVILAFLIGSNTAMPTGNVCFDYLYLYPTKP
jgi:hypothetical protein